MMTKSLIQSNYIAFYLIIWQQLSLIGLYIYYLMANQGLGTSIQLKTSIRISTMKEWRKNNMPENTIASSLFTSYWTTTYFDAPPKFPSHVTLNGNDFVRPSKSCPVGECYFQKLDPNSIDITDCDHISFLNDYQNNNSLLLALSLIMLIVSIKTQVPFS